MSSPSENAALAAEVRQLREFINNNPSTPGAPGSGSGGGYTAEQLQDGRFRLTSVDHPERSITVTRQAVEQYQREEEARNAAETQRKLQNRPPVGDAPLRPMPPEGMPQPPVQLNAPLLAGAFNAASIAGAVASATSGMTTAVALTGATASGSIAGSPIASNSGAEITVTSGHAGGVSAGRQ